MELVLRSVDVSEVRVRFVEVAVPEIVRPPACVPLPMVVEARDKMPALNVSVVEVALFGNS